MLEPSSNYPMNAIDTMVFDAFKRTVYTPEHISVIIDELRKLTSETCGIINPDAQAHSSIVYGAA